MKRSSQIVKLGVGANDRNLIPRTGASDQMSWCRWWQPYV